MELTLPMHRALHYAKNLVTRSQPRVITNRHERILKRTWRDEEIEINAATMNTKHSSHTSLDVWYKHRPVFTVSYNRHLHCFKYENGGWEGALERAYQTIDTAEPLFTRESQPAYQ